jgi:hypothetical protein
MWSLGCVFLEICATLCGQSPREITEYMKEQGSFSTLYHSNQVAIDAWCRRCTTNEGYDRYVPLYWTMAMLKKKPEARWTARMLCDRVAAVNNDPDVSFSYIGRCCTEDDDSAESVLSNDDYHPPPTPFSNNQDAMTIEQSGADEPQVLPTLMLPEKPPMMTEALPQCELEQQDTPHHAAIQTNNITSDQTEHECVESLQEGSKSSSPNQERSRRMVQTDLPRPGADQDHAITQGSISSPMRSEANINPAKINHMNDISPPSTNQLICVWLKGNYCGPSALAPRPLRRIQIQGACPDPGLLTDCEVYSINRRPPRWCYKKRLSETKLSIIASRIANVLDEMGFAYAVHARGFACMYPMSLATNLKEQPSSEDSMTRLAHFKSSGVLQKKWEGYLEGFKNFDNDAAGPFDDYNQNGLYSESKWNRWVFEMEIVIYYVYYGHPLRRQETLSVGFRGLERNSSGKTRSSRNSSEVPPRCQLLAKLILQRLPLDLKSNE